MSKNLTNKQTQILEFIKDSILHKGFPPSVREICDAVNLKSPSSVHLHLQTLEKNGYIRRDSTHRSIEIIDNDFNLSRREVSNIPIVGKVAAGSPILASENITNYFPIPNEFLNFNNNDNFMLKVSGDSMINAGIFDNDLILVNKTNTANNNDIIVALIDDEATVKRFYKDVDHIKLIPENDSMYPIICDNIIILGKVIGVFRFL